MIGLDMIRSVAILSVLFAHSMWMLYGMIPKVKFVDSLFVFGSMIFGFFGVELFFVLSGFLIGSIFIKELVYNNNSNENLSFQVSRFWIKRWFRTLPNYYLYVILYLIISWFISSQDYNSFSWRYLLFVQNFFSSGPGFFYVAWSLAVEEWFYLLLPSIYIVFLLINGKAITAFKISMGLLFAIPFLLRILFVMQHNWFGQFSQAFNLTTIYRLDSIAYGIALAWLWNHKSSRQKLVYFKRRLLTTGICSFISVLIFLYFFVAKPNQNGFFVLISYPWATISITLCFPYFIDLTNIAFTKSIKVTSFISKISYSLYLVHPLVVILLDFGMKQMNLDKALWVGPVTFIFFFILSIFFAFLTYRFCELPFLNLRERLILRLSNQKA